MQEMSANMATLLKSGKQIGVNRPSHEIYIGDGAKDITGIDWTTTKTIRGDWSGLNWYGDDWGGGSFVTRSDGKILVTYSNLAENKVYLSVVNSESDLFYQDNLSATNEWVFDSVQIDPQELVLTGIAHSRLQKLSDGSILLYIMDYGVRTISPNIVRVYKSVNGLGTDFTILATLYSYLAPSTGFGTGDVGLGQPIQLDTGRVIIPYVGFVAYSSKYYQTAIFVSYSDDFGATWNRVTIYAHEYMATFTGRGIAKFNNRLVLASGRTYGSGSMRFYYSDDAGETWGYVQYPAVEIGEGIYDALFWGANGFNFWYHYDGSVNRLYYTLDSVDLPNDSSCFDRTDLWKEIDIIGDDSLEVAWVTDGGKLAFAGTSHYSSGSIARINGADLEIIGDAIVAKSIQISRSKGMAGQLTVEFDNKDAVLAPDGLSNPQLLWPNKEVIVKQGYGTELIQTFKGLIDSISMSTFPQSISISARDKMKALLDHLARDSSFSYVLTYTGQTVEAIWQDLITKAGLTYGTVETTGITLTEKIFSWQTYADAISWLDEIAGFETYCDEFGIMHFVYDGRPETVAVAYEFVEGVDIIQLGYDIDDKDLYYSVAVYGKDATDAVIYYAATLPQAGYWNIPSGKVMRIDAPDADTSAKCQAIAEKAIYLMQTRARQVRFSTIGIPHLQRGDFIQVTEASSTISEIYRITDISTSQDSSGYRMELTCYYHAAPEV